MPTGKITQANPDESEKGTVTLDQGTFKRWLVTIMTEAGEMIGADVLRKPDSPSPVGEAVEQKPNGRWKVAGKGGGNFGGGRGKSPEETKAIQRQHSQEMAIRAMALGHQIGVTTVQGPMSGEEFRNRIEAWTNWFEGNIGG